MEENKKKVTTEKKNETKNKNAGAPKNNGKSNSKAKKVETTSPEKKAKSTVEKETKIAKKVEPEKKEATKKVEKSTKVEASQKKTEKKENKDLEKTIIFDGRESKNISDVVNKLEEDKVVLEDKVVERSKTKKNIIIALTILIVAVIVATSMYVISTQIKEEKDNQTLESNVYQKVSERYSSSKEIEKDKNENLIKNDTQYANIETISLSRLEEKILAREDMAVLVASETCYASMSFEPIIDEVFNAENKTIYKINISKLTSTEEARFRTYYAFKSTPTIFTIKAGIITAEQVGTTTKENLTSWVKENVQ